MPISCKKQDDLPGRSIFGVEYNTKNPIVITDGSTSHDNGNHCTARGWITRDTFRPHMQRTIVKVRMSTGKVSTDSSQVLPCALEELGCETISLATYAYIWDYPDNYVLSVLRTEKVNMVKKSNKILYHQWTGLNNKIRIRKKTSLKNKVEKEEIFNRPITIHCM